MICKSCGAHIPNGTQYCTSCGARQEQTYHTDHRFNDFQTGSSYAPFSGFSYEQPQQGMPMSVGGWIGRSLIPFIPIVGGLIYIIMLFVWSGDLTKELTFRNWAKAQLVVWGIAIAIAVFFGILGLIGIFTPRYFS